MPAFDPSLATLEQARDWCRVQGNAQDRLLSELIVAASQLAEDETDRKLKKRTFASGGDFPALVLNGSGTRMQCVRHFPIVSVSVVEFLDSDFPEVWTPQNLTTYPVQIDDEQEDLIFFRALSFPRGYRNVRVSMVAGYDPIPAKLSLAVREMVTSFYLNRDKQLAGVASKTFEGQTITYTAEDIPKQAKTLLRGFARHAAF